MNIHARIDDPVEIRKNVLKTAVELNELIQISHDFGAIKSKKTIRLRKLSAVLNNLERSVKSLNRNIPEESFENKKVKKEAVMDDELLEIKKKLKELRD